MAEEFNDLDNFDFDELIKDLDDIDSEQNVKDDSNSNKEEFNPDDFDLDDFDDFENEQKDKEKENDTFLNVRKEDHDIDSYEILDTNNEIYLKFNKLYKEYNQIINKESLSDLDKEKKFNLAEEIAIMIASDFDFTDSKIKNVKSSYVKYAIDLLKLGCDEDNYRPLSMLYYIKALFGQTNLAYDLSSEEKQKKYISLGSEYVTLLEKNTNIRSLKAYALTLRAYAYIMMGDSLELKPGVKMKTIYNDLVYSIAWDCDNYLSHYAVGLMYLNTYANYYSVKKAKEHFEIVLKLETKKCDLDNYISLNEKQRIVSLANKRLKEI